MGTKEKCKAAQELAKMRAESMTPFRRSEIARNAQTFSVQSRARNKARKTAQDAQEQAKAGGDAT